MKTIRLEVVDYDKSLDELRKKLVTDDAADVAVVIDSFNKLKQTYETSYAKDIPRLGAVLMAKVSPVFRAASNLRSLSDLNPRIIEFFPGQEKAPPNLKTEPPISRDS